MKTMNIIESIINFEAFSFVFESISDSVFITDSESVILDVNTSMLRSTGYSKNELIGKKINIIKSNKHDSEFYKKIWKSLIDKGFWQGDIWNQRKGGDLYPVSSKIIKGVGVNDSIIYIGIYRDLSETYKINKVIQNLSKKDILTKLPNKYVFKVKLNELLSTREEEEEVLLSVIKLLNLNEVNESSGAEAGDKVLVEFVSRINSILEENITFARLEGTKFAILFKSKNSLKEFQNIVEMINFSLKETFYNKDIKDHFFKIISGTVVSPMDGDTSDILMKNASSTLKKAKEVRGHYFFSDNLKKNSSRRILITNELRKELRRFKNIIPYYQAKVDKNGIVTGAEVLARWFHPKIGFISPLEFIPIAEESGMIIKLGEYILDKACENISLFKDIPSDFKIAVNLSSIQFNMPDLVEKIDEILLRHKISYKHLEVEVTETMLQGNMEGTIITLNKLRDMGVTIALDDFGTGYSSLQYLKNLPLDMIKIDQSFVFSMLNSKKDMAIVETIINLGKNLDMKLIAEGVETKNNVNSLIEIGCDYFQGYYFHKPSSWEYFIDFLHKSKL